MGVTIRSNKQTTAVAHNNVEGINTTYLTEAIFTPRTSIFIDLVVWEVGWGGIMVASHGKKKKHSWQTVALSDCIMGKKSDFFKKIYLFLIQASVELFFPLPG